MAIAARSIDSSQRRTIVSVHSREFIAAAPQDFSRHTSGVQWDGKVQQTVGCEHCSNTGYIGRIGIIETFEITDDIKTMIMEGASTLLMYSKARETGYLTMKEDGILKMLDGLTTLEEIRRVI